MLQIPIVKILRRKSYLAMVRNAAAGEARLFRNVYALVDGTESDITGDGQWACAFFASSVLFINKLIGDMHTGVAGLENDLQTSGWVHIQEPREGAVLVWQAQEGSFVPGIGQMHSHMGFYIGNDRAVSNFSGEPGVPREHHWTYDGARHVARIWWHSALDEK